MSSESLAIEARGLGKRYEIYQRPQDRLKQMLLPRLARASGLGERRYYREFWALRGVDLAVRRGETVGVIGRNGSGKSTLLQTICGTLDPTEGRVDRQGRIAALLELGAGFNPEFTGYENLLLSGLLYGIDEARLRERIPSIIEFADIGDFVHQPVKTYSSGMYVRLAFSIAAHVDAETLVIDEALAVGDVRFTQKCMRFLRDFQSRGTLLFVSHDAGAVVNLCARAIWLDGGRLRMDGPARNVVEAYLAEQHAQDRAEAGDAVSVRRGTVGRTARGAGGSPKPSAPDLRAEVLSASSRGCRVQVFEFDEAAAVGEFGMGGARISDVRLEPAESGGLLEGGEIVDLHLTVEASEPLHQLILGFYVKDRLGQRLFGDNTYLTTLDDPVEMRAGERLTARFRFRLPLLPPGDYSIDAAAATGTQDNHAQRHWIHDALAFRVVSSGSGVRGLVGVPMIDIGIEQASITTT